MYFIAGQLLSHLAVQLYVGICAVHNQGFAVHLWMAVAGGI